MAEPLDPTGYARKVKDSDGKDFWKGEYMAADPATGQALSICKSESWYWQWQPLPPGNEEKEFWVRLGSVEDWPNGCPGTGLANQAQSSPPKPPAMLKLDSQGSAVPDQGQSASRAQPAEVTQPKANVQPEEEAKLKAKKLEKEAKKAEAKAAAASNGGGGGGGGDRRSYLETVSDVVGGAYALAQPWEASRKRLALQPVSRGR